MQEATEQGQVVDSAREALENLLELMGTEALVTARSTEDQVILDLTGSDAAMLIGRKGETLDAVQFVVNRIVSRRIGDHPIIVVDADGYRSRREASLVQLAERLSEKAISEGKVVALNPMSARDRRVIHMTLRDMPEVSTRSEGEGEDRRLLIVPEG